MSIVCTHGLLLSRISDLFSLSYPCPLEKAILFYTGYLSAEDNRAYLPSVIVSTMKGIVAESENKQGRALFKLAVEMAIMMNLIAAKSDVDELMLERLRGACVAEVKRLNGNFTFEDALNWQKG